MSLREKLEHLAEKQAAVPKMLEQRADDLLARLAVLEEKDRTVFGPLHHRLSEHEAGMSEVEHMVETFERGVNLPINGSGQHLPGADSTDQKVKDAS